MNCKNCGFPIVENDQFCKNCGAPVIKDNVPDNNLNNNVVNNQINNTMPNFENNNAYNMNNLNSEGVTNFQNNIGGAVIEQVNNFQNNTPEPVNNMQNNIVEPVNNIGEVAPEPMNTFQSNVVEPVNNVVEPNNFGGNTIPEPVNNLNNNVINEPVNNLNNFNGPVNNQDTINKEPVNNFAPNNNNQMNNEPVNNFGMNEPANNLNNNQMPVNDSAMGTPSFPNNFSVPTNNTDAFNNTYTNNFGQPNNMNMNQNIYPNNYNGNVQSPNKKSSGALKFIIIGIVGVLVLSGIIFGVITFVNKNSSNGISKVSSTYQIEFGNFTFDIPNEYVYNAKSNYFVLNNKSDTWAVRFEVVTGQYKNYVANRTKVKEIIEKQGYVINNSQEKTLGGVTHYAMEATSNNMNYVITLAPADDTHTFILTAYSVSNTFDYSPLESVASVIKSAKYSTSGNSISIENPIDFSIIEEFGR